MYIIIQNTNEHTPNALFVDGTGRNVTYVKDGIYQYDWHSWHDAPTEGVQGSDIITFDTGDSYGEVKQAVKLIFYGARSASSFPRESYKRAQWSFSATAKVKKIAI